MLRQEQVTCPYCGETFETGVDASAGTQEYIEDCQVCCRPIVFQIEVDHAGDLCGVRVKRDDD
jgi:hypothetical protein